MRRPDFPGPMTEGGAWEGQCWVVAQETADDGERHHGVSEREPDPLWAASPTTCGSSCPPAAPLPMGFRKAGHADAGEAPRRAGRETAPARRGPIASERTR